MFKKWISAGLIFAMLVSLLPMQTHATAFTTEKTSGAEEQADASRMQDASETQDVFTTPGMPFGAASDAEDKTSAEDAAIVKEIVERRTEYSKEYKLDNGLNMAVVYAEPVHYLENGQWKEIDNTLTAENVGKFRSYKNTAGSFGVELPKELSEDTYVAITKDGYTVSFAMAGELRLGTASAARAKESTGKIHAYDYSLLKEQAKHPEVIRDKVKSRMSYSDVYENTDVIYDIESYQLKESIVIHAYDPAVYGYSYLLCTDGLVPVLKEDGGIELLAPDAETVVMTMPAPFMVDAEGVVNPEVAVTLKETKGGYLLTYRLPKAWMAEEGRAWPVVLDPVVRPGTTTSNILDHFVAENYSASNSHGYLYAGHHTTYGDMRTFIKFSAIPDFTAADIVVNAKLKLNYAGGSSGYTIIEAHEVYDSWTTGGITWAGQPDFNQTVQDYQVVGGTGIYTWDITDIAYGWYLGANNGVMLKATDAIENGSTAGWKQFYSVDYSKTNTSYWPYLEITYQSATGIEDYWDYTTTVAGRAGSGYISNTTGNMTWVHSDLGFDGNLMPVSISHIYTLSERNETKYGLGKGWRTNFHQTIEAAESGDCYIWRDGDGTMHDFNPTTTAGVYKDEDGLRLTLTVTSSGYTITDIYGNKSNFDSYGRLISMVNNQTIKSSITITYNGTTNRIATITDGANRVYKFTYNSSNLLSKIGYHGKKNADGTVGTEITNVQFTYNSSSKLTKITYKDGLYSQFTYDSTKLLTAMDIDDYKVKFSYTTGITKRIASVEEFDGTLAGNKIIIGYAHNKAKISDSEHTVIRHYNDYGNVVSVQDEEGNGQFYEYAENQYVEKPAYKNQLIAVSKEQNTVVNLAKHGSFEGGNVWSGVEGLEIERTTSKAYAGNYSLKIQTGYAVSVVDAKGEPITLDAGKSCTFSAYVQTDEASVQIGILEAGIIRANSDSQIPGTGWKRLEVSYTNTSNANITIYPVIMHHHGGTIYLDGVQIEMTAGASRYNLIENGDFRTGDSWTGSGVITSVPASAAPQLDKKGYRITGNPTLGRLGYQTVKVSGNAEDVFVVSGWAKGQSAPLYGNIHQFGIRVVFLNTDGSTTPRFVSFSGTFDAAEDWEYVAGRAEADKAYSSIRVELVYHNNVNEVCFDGIQLYKEEFGERYTYDAYGNLETVTDVLGLKTTYEYENYDPITIVEPNGLTVKNAYENHNLVSSRRYYTETDEPANLPYDCYVYNDYGNVIRTETLTGDIRNTVYAGYSADENYQVSITDISGGVTTYEYDLNTGLLLSVKTPEDTNTTKTQYAYDKDMFYLASITKKTGQGETMSVGYVYENDHLVQVSTGSSVYHFEYNDYSLQEKISVGSNILASYQYTDDVYHRLKEVTYGNDDKIKYTYDDAGRVITEEYSENGSDAVSRKISYEYNNSGALAKMVDYKNEITTMYYYDTIGRSTGMYESGANRSHRLKFDYDSLGRIYKTTEYYGNKSFSSEYTYNVNGQLSELCAGNTREKYNYDLAGRLQSWSTYHGTTTDPLVEKYIEYEWFEKEEGFSTQDRPIQWNYEADGYSVYYTYAYDANGNIVSEHVVRVDADGTETAATTTYVYDSANQLIRENNQAAGTTKVWTYDDAGNIESRAEYSYTTGMLGDLDETYTYTYANSNWGDLLIGYDGATITYDAIGNPLSDGTWNYSWEEGRKLASMSRGSSAWTFTYDANGMRIRRANGSAIYNYTYHGSQLSHMTYGSNELHFYYDASGRPLSVIYNDVIYYYVLNLQGDVVAILDSEGMRVVGYSYDAWGNPVAITGDMSATLGLHNPLRYRGYVYDWETGLYYLQSRYYNPETGRFINADSLISTGQGVLGYNMFAYCNNNPVNMVDPSGEIAVSTVILIVSIVAAVAFGGYTAYASYVQTGEVDIIATIAVTLSTFMTVYSCGMTAYCTYLNCCQYWGYAPVYEIGWDKKVGTSAAHTMPTGSTGTKGGTGPQGVGNPVEVAGRGSTGRTIPNTLKEQMAMHQVRSNPLNGARDLSQLDRNPIIMTDQRWPHSEGWVKMSNNVNGIEIHFVYNKITGAFDDFKFK